MKSSQAIGDALSAWRPIESAPDLAHETFELLDADEITRLAIRAYTDEVRAALRRKDVNGVPAYTSVLAPATDGKTVRVYKQTALFTEADYRAAVRFYRREADSNRRVADALVKDCKRRLGIQLRITDSAA